MEPEDVEVAVVDVDRTRPVGDVLSVGGKGSGNVRWVVRTHSATTRGSQQIIFHNLFRNIEPNEGRGLLERECGERGRRGGGLTRYFATS